MTLFANSGASFPELEEITREAGKRTLRSASDLWRLFSLVEGRFPSKQASEEELGLSHHCVNMFRDSAKTYKEIIGRIKNFDDGRWITKKITLADAELAASDIASELFTGDLPRLRQIYEGEWINLELLYNEIVKRLENLSSLVASLNLQYNKEDIAPQIFQMMRQWEMLATLGRIISVANRQSQSIKSVS